MPDFDEIQKASWYNNHPSKIECISLIRMLPGCMFNAVKYLWRSHLKGAPTKDLLKAAYYLEEEAKLLYLPSSYTVLYQFPVDTLRQVRDAEVDNPNQALYMLLTILLNSKLLGNMSYDDHRNRIALQLLGLVGYIKTWVSLDRAYNVVTSMLTVEYPRDEDIIEYSEEPRGNLTLIHALNPKMNRTEFQGVKVNVNSLPSEEEIMQSPVPHVVAHALLAEVRARRGEELKILLTLYLPLT
jgi:Protein of unknwon function (DUF3310)